MSIPSAKTTLILLAACAAPAFAQERSPASSYAIVQYSHMRMRQDNGTVQGASGSGLSLRLGLRPLASTPRLLAEGAATYIPESDDPFDGHPSVRGANLGALYSVFPLGVHKGPFNPFAALSAGFISYGDPPGDPVPCPPDECLDESPDLHGTEPSIALGGGSWIWLGAGVGLRLDLRMHHRFAESDGAEDAWSPEISAGAGYHF